VHPAAAGKQGIAGPQGNPGLQGLTGAPGSAGPPGESALAYHVNCLANPGLSGSSPGFNTVVVGINNFNGELQYADLQIRCTVIP
jgi:hypothetical protein